MKNIAIFYGGKSVEHEVSIITAMQVIENLDREQFIPIPIYIDKTGKWWKMENPLKKEKYKNFSSSKKQKVVVTMGSNVLKFKNKFCSNKKNIDGAIIACHGTNGEDGVLQGVLESLNIPYSGCNVMSSAICMNKIVMKQLFERFKMPVTNWVFCKRGENLDLSNLTLKFPLIVKPANLGSSVGINKCDNLEELKTALEVAFEFDEYVIVEECVLNLMEINCSVQNIDTVIVTSELESPISLKKFLTYEEKYVGKNKDAKRTVLAPKISKALRIKVESLSKEAYAKFWLNGVIRIDYLYNKETKELYINEINTIPGSLSFYLWKPKGLSFKKHLTLQLLQAFDKKKEQEKNKTSFISTLLD